MVRLCSFRLSTPSASIFPIPTLLQKNCSHTQESFRNKYSHSAFCLCNSQCILTQVWVIILRDNYPQRELKVSTFSRLVTHLSSLVISSCLQTDIPQKEYLQGVQNPSAYTNSFITPMFLRGIHFCWFVFDLGAIIKIPNHTTCRLLHIETRKDNSIKRFS